MTRPVPPDGSEHPSDRRILLPTGLHSQPLEAPKPSGAGASSFLRRLIPAQKAPTPKLNAPGWLLAVVKAAGEILRLRNPTTRRGPFAKTLRTSGVEGQNRRVTPLRMTGAFLCSMLGAVAGIDVHVFDGEVAGPDAGGGAAGGHVDADGHVVGEHFSVGGG